MIIHASILQTTGLAGKQIVSFPAFLFKSNAHCIVYFKAENLVLRARSESVGFAEIVNKDRMVGTKAFVP